MIPKPLGNTALPRLIGAGYFSAVGARNLYYDRFPGCVRKSRFRTVSIGGIHAGGTGKTPLTALAATMLAQKNIPTIIASRGYGRLSRNPVVIAPGATARWQDIGDEPAMLRERLVQTWFAIGSNRYDALEMLPSFLPSCAVVLLDDGFQHRKLHRDRDIVCLPLEPFSHHPIPAGFLREPFSALSRASLICVIGSDQSQEAIIATVQEVRGRYPGIDAIGLMQHPGLWVNVFTGERCPEAPVRKPAVVCGIANPKRFVRALELQSHDCSHLTLLPDHYRYRPEDFRRICFPGCDGVLTTEKDAVKIKGLKLVNTPDIWYLSLLLTFVESSSEAVLLKTLMI